jgi:membrane protein DedA with SNARE-associated domain
MTEFITNFINQYGYIAIFLLLAIENIFPPIPSELILTFTGFMTLSSNLDVFWSIVIATLGSIIGSLTLYGVGRLLNEERLKSLVNGRVGKITRITPEQIDKTLSAFARFGNWSVFLGRFIPIVRSLVSIPAGMTKQKIWFFTLLTAIGSGIWNTALIFAGRIAGSAFEQIADQTDKWSKILLGIAVVLIAGGWAIKHFWFDKKSKKES